MRLASSVSSCLSLPLLASLCLLICLIYSAVYAYSGIALDSSTFRMHLWFSCAEPQPTDNCRVQARCAVCFATLSLTSLLFELCVFESRSVVTRSSTQLGAEVLMLPRHITVYAVCCLQSGVRVRRPAHCQTPALPFIPHNDGVAFRY